MKLKLKKLLKAALPIAAVALTIAGKRKAAAVAKQAAEALESKQREGRSA